MIKALLGYLPRSSTATSAPPRKLEAPQELVDEVVSSLETVTKPSTAKVRKAVASALAVPVSRVRSHPEAAPVLRAVLQTTCPPLVGLAVSEELHQILAERDDREAFVADSPEPIQRLLRWHQTSDQLREASFLTAAATDQPDEQKYKWELADLAQTRPITDRSLAEAIGGPFAHPDQLQGLAAKLKFETVAGQKVKTELFTVENQKGGPNVVLYGVVREQTTDDVEAIFSVKLSPNKKQDDALEAAITNTFVKMEDRVVKNFADTVLDFFGDLYSGLDRPVLRETVKADFFGRKVWAERGFDFSSLPWQKIGGQGEAHNLREIARLNLQALAQAHGLSEEGLSFERNGQRVPLESFEHLQAPAGFLSVRHAEGKIPVRPMDGWFSTRSPVKLELGEAFMLGTHCASQQELASGDFAKGHFSPPFSRLAMPYYPAERPIAKP